VTTARAAPARSVGVLGLGQFDFGVAARFAAVHELQRIRPGTGRARLGLVFVLGVLGFDVQRAGPVLGRLRGLEFALDPLLDLEFLDGAVEVLNLDRTIVAVDGDDFERVSSGAPVPLANDGCELRHGLNLYRSRCVYPLIYRALLVVLRGDEFK
jgi:hypothetical protein